MAKILVVDDDTKIQMVIRIMLERAGYEVRWALCRVSRDGALQ